MTSSLTIQTVQYIKAIAPIQKIRRQVFQMEQGVAEALEFDGEDDHATHFLAYQGDEAVGTTRIRYLKKSAPLPASLPITTDSSTTDGPRTIAKIERVAVLADYRGQGIGQQLMAAAIAHLQHQDITAIMINAQLQVQAFYERLGFRPRGAVFEEAGIPHVEMWYQP